MAKSGKFNLLCHITSFESMTRLTLRPSYKKVYMYYVRALVCFHYLWFLCRVLQFGLPIRTSNVRFIRYGFLHNAVRFSSMRSVYNMTNYRSVLYVFRTKKKQRRSIFFVRQLERHVSLTHINSVYDRLSLYYYV